MYRKIITPTQQDNLIKIPKEYWNQQVEILVLPFSEILSKVQKMKKRFKRITQYWKYKHRRSEGFRLEYREVLIDTSIIIDYLRKDK